MYDELKYYLEKHPEIIEKTKYSISNLKKYHLGFFKELGTISLFNECNFHWKKRIYYILNNLTELQLCKICKKNEPLFYNLKKGYSDVCSIECSRKNPEWKIKSHKNVDYQSRSVKFKNTMRKKYGVDNPSQLENIKKKKKETCLKNYGVDHPLKNVDIVKIVSEKNREKIQETLEKRKQTCLDKYGVENYTETDEFKNTMKDIWKNEEYKKGQSEKRKEYLNQSGVKEGLSNRLKKFHEDMTFEERDRISKKISDSLKDVYSNDEEKKEIIQKRNISIVKNCSDDIINQLIDDEMDIEKDLYKKILSYYTKLGVKEKYGVESVFQIPEVQDKCKETIKRKYGVDNISQHIFFKELYRYRSDDNIREIFSKKFSVIQIQRDSDYRNNKLELQCLTCNYKFLLKFHGIIYDKVVCPNCSLTNIEETIKEFLNEVNIPYIIKDRRLINPYELDFLIKKHNLAIESNGLYWHSDLFCDKFYHYNKYIKCREKGIKLLQFFEDDILNKKDIVKSIIHHNLNIHNVVIHGRKCIIKYINRDEKSKFLSENHLMGNDKSQVYIGAFYNDELVSIMTFIKNNITINDKAFDWELSRFCSKNFYKIHGIANKLFKYFLKNEREDIEIKTYASLMTGNGLVYEKLGFQFIHTSIPGYFYFKNGCRYHRFKALSFRKDKTLTERDEMLQHGYCRIFDAGNNKYIYSLRKEDC